MFQNQHCTVLIPVYNESSQITHVIHSLPSFIDALLIVNDASTDETLQVIERLIHHNPKLIVLSHSVNKGAGASISTGYEWLKNNSNTDIVITVDGDGQMNPNNIEDLILPIVKGEAEFTKGNRFFSRKAWEKMPRLRFLGNAFLSLLTKIASGYWHISDFQTGFTALHRNALNKVNWNILYPRYGYPNHRAVLLNVEQVRVKDVEIDIIYGVGEKSKMKISKVLFTMPLMLFKQFIWRMKEKYIIRDFHPMIFFYGLGIIFFFLSTLLFGRVFYYWLILDMKIPSINALAAMFSALFSTQFLLFAMWFDMEANKNLK